MPILNFIMTSEEIDKEFQEAYKRASRTDQKFPPDIMLQFYAYYKQATEQEGIYTPSGEDDVRNAFKLNALLQIKGMSIKEAKKNYIDLVNRYITE
ncbi:Acyl-CoA-binding protein [Salinimicrobium catena]|uniref:Acyl-CoA-binding protein n=1 Tax=Salinimicrobium catena TaxID=390640 RepID=A0A1H5NMJ8_9FLAO|nr:acyl-CoA-binding protein [Salinimicrobium catena]SDL56801.1 Acyl-CoA-binding protein [Salinimicrobium catena]SEF02823.1 Acyl-CoA-binding protein [Salinimicrobium catena]